MAIVVVPKTSSASLLSLIKEKVLSSKIETWTVDSSGDFTHSPPQWKHKAWFRPKASEDELVFRILTPRGSTMSKTVYAVYHGRFIEMLLAHFDTDFVAAEASALPRYDDIIKA